MNKFNLEITYKDICSVTHNITPNGDELIVALFDGSIIKAYHYENPPSYILNFEFKSDNEKYEALSRVVNDYLKYANAIHQGYDLFGKALKEVEAELEAN